MKAVILAAGKGTRLYPLTITTPKILLPLFGKPLIEWFIELLKDHTEEIVFVIGDNDYSRKIQEYIQNSSEKREASIKINFVYQTEQKGTGDALQAAKDLFQPNEKFILLYGDDLYAKEDLENLLKQEYGILGKKVSDPEKWGILQEDENGNLKEIIEKPETFVGDIGNIGMYLLDSRIFELFENTELSKRGEFEITDGVSLFAKEKQMKVIAVEKYWLPLGYPWMILDAQEQLLKNYGFNIVDLENQDKVYLENNGDIDSKRDRLSELGIVIEPNVQINGKVILGRNVRIKSGSYFEGEVIIDEGCMIGPNAYLRGITSLGKNVKVGMSEIKNSIVMDDSNLPHFNYFADGLMGKNVNFALGCFAMNLRHDNANIQTMIKEKLVDTGRRKFSTVIGDNVKFGAATKIYPGRKVWPNLTTLPDQVITKDLTAEESSSEEQVS